MTSQYHRVEMIVRKAFGLQQRINRLLVLCMKNEMYVEFSDNETTSNKVTNSLQTQSKTVYRSISGGVH